VAAWAGCLTIVQNKLLLPGGAPLSGLDGQGRPIPGREVTIVLVANGFVDADQYEILSTFTALPDPTGTYQVDLVPQSQIDPTGTHYEVTHPGGEVLSFVVSDAAGPLWLRDLLVENPSSPSPVIAGVTSAQLSTAIAGANSYADTAASTAQTNAESFATTAATQAKDWRGNELAKFDPTRDTRDLVALWRFTDLSGNPGDAVGHVSCKAHRGGDLMNDIAATTSVVLGSGTPSGAATLRTSATSMLANRNFGNWDNPAWGYPAVGGEFTIAALCKGDSAAGLATTRFPVATVNKAGLFTQANDGRLSVGGPSQGAAGGASPCDDAWHMLVGRFSLGWTDVWCDAFLQNGAIRGGTSSYLTAQANQGATSLTTNVSYASGAVIGVGTPGTESYEIVTASGASTGSAGAYSTPIAATPTKAYHPNGEQLLPLSSPARILPGPTQLRSIGIGGSPGNLATSAWVGEFAEVAIWRRNLYPDEILAYTAARFTACGIDTSGLPAAQGMAPYLELATDANGQSVTFFDPNRNVIT
jgi:hypothetical protein